MKIILASSSPRRVQLLKQIGLIFDIFPVELDEQQFDYTNPHCLVRNLALAKALIAAKAFTSVEGVSIGADTIVMLEGKIIGKPKTAKEAREILTGLSGKFHEVITGIALVSLDGQKQVVDSVSTRVKFRNLTSLEIDGYIKTGEPMDKAGAYGIQGKGALLVEQINGCYYNVVGLPISRLMEILADFGYNIFIKGKKKE